MKVEMLCLNCGTWCQSTPCPCGDDPSRYTTKLRPVQEPPQSPSPLLPEGA